MRFRFAILLVTIVPALEGCPLEDRPPPPETSRLDAKTSQRLDMIETVASDLLTRVGELERAAEKARLEKVESETIRVLPGEEKQLGELTFRVGPVVDFQTSPEAEEDAQLSRAPGQIFTPPTVTFGTNPIYRVDEDGTIELVDGEE